MDRDSLRALARRVASRDIRSDVRFIHFLTRSVLSVQTEDILYALENSAPIDGSEYLPPREPQEYGELDPWEVDAAEAQNYFQAVIGLIREEDVHAAYRFIDYCLDGNEDANIERETYDIAKELQRRFDKRRPDM
jgi:hypothetical protein